MLISSTPQVFALDVLSYLNRECDGGDNDDGDDDDDDDESMIKMVTMSRINGKLR